MWKQFFKLFRGCFITFLDRQLDDALFLANRMTKWFNDSTQKRNPPPTCVTMIIYRIERIQMSKSRLYHQTAGQMSDKLKGNYFKIASHNTQSFKRWFEEWSIIYICKNKEVFVDVDTEFGCDSHLLKNWLRTCKATPNFLGYCTWKRDQFKLFQHYKLFFLLWSARKDF